MIAIRDEIDGSRRGSGPPTTARCATRRTPAADVADRRLGPRPYTRELAAFPVAALRRDKYWPPVSRIDGAYGDRNVMCSCPPIEAYED